MYKILIIEDDITIAKALSRHLSKWSLNCEYATDFKNITEEYIKIKPDMVLLDISLPYFNGFYWCGEIRKISKVPIIFISSQSENMNIIMAMNMGGDDFISKPFDLNIVTAKIQALLRRTYSFTETFNVIQHKGVLLNLNTKNINFRDKEIELTKNEFIIMQLLMEKKGETVSRDQLMAGLWGNDEFIDDNTLTVNITRLRKKLEDNNIELCIKTKKGIGYMVE